MPLDPHAAVSPVQWLEWGPAAFARARKENRPILLRISAVWCHWCHVMDETTDAEPEVARRINSWFIPVRVDNDERPDINDRYNLGGWPTTAFLTPDGALITGGTYFPAAQFTEILERIHQAWDTNRDALDDEVRRVRQRRQETKTPRRDAAGAGDLAASIAGMVESVLDAYDWRYGGFGTQPKFPQPEAVRLLLHAAAGSGATAPRDAAANTLTAMRTAGRAEGRWYGLYDHAAGGFFRYATTRDWSEPHFEKMSEDNARLALAYLDGARLLGDALYADTVRGIFGFVLGTLSDPAGGAYGSQDADGEAGYYGLPLAERAGLPEPYIDRRCYTNWNGMLVAAAFESAAVLEWPELAAWAERTVARLSAALATPDGAMRHVWRPEALGAEVDADAPLLLGDQAWWLQARLAAYQATGDPAHRDAAGALALVIERDFFDAGRGACRDRPAGTSGEGALADPVYPLADNAAAAQGLATYAALGGGARWRERAVGLLGAMQGEAERHGFLGAAHTLAAAHVLGEPVQVHVVGAADDPRLRALWSVAWKTYLPNRSTEILDPARNAERLAALRYPPDGPPRAYVCIGDRCLEPAEDAEALALRFAAIAAGPVPAGPG